MARKRIYGLLLVVILLLCPHKIVFEKMAETPTITRKQNMAIDKDGVPVVTKRFYVDGKLSMVEITRKGADYEYYLCVLLHRR